MSTVNPSTDESFRLDRRKLTPSLRRAIFLHALQLMFMRVHMFWRDDTKFYPLSIIGVIFSAIPVPSRLLHLLTGVCIFLVFFFPNSRLFYVLYGLILGNTNFSVASLCLSLHRQSSRFLGQLELLCLLFSCLIKIEYDIVSLIFAITIFICTIVMPEPPIEIVQVHKSNLKPTFHGIKCLIGTNDYALMAQEHKLVLTYKHKMPNFRFPYFLEFIDWHLPMLFCDLPIMLKAWAFITVVFEVRKWYIMNPVIYVLISLKIWVIAAIIAPFRSLSPCSVPHKILNAFNIIIMILTGYALCIIFDIIMI